MSVLILRLAGPLQSWGTTSRHMTRSTLSHPTKSGILGLLASAVGIDRTADTAAGIHLTDLHRLRFATRADQPGLLLTDYHTVSGASHAPLTPTQQRLPTADGGRLRPRDSTKVTHRHYLADAVFTAYLDGPPDTLTTLALALQRPRYPLFLGRRSCPPSRPLLIGYQHELSLEAALAHTPWQAAEHEIRRHRTPTVQLATITDDPTGSDSLPDQPLPGAPLTQRRHTQRPVHHGHITLTHPTNTTPAPQPPGAAHDPFELLD
ncbi:type I-E CRISPR-associated protein Cas5/CasD [Streptomyces sp. NPDC050523]|uniref:type I-E CRISPR-associated protein Cas5/CasD n=1 Tax=Streptomyces sp. NPDC050523 TaxID=3365622 RepID=UPI0037945EB8